MFRSCYFLVVPYWPLYCWVCSYLVVYASLPLIDTGEACASGILSVTNRYSWGWWLPWPLLQAQVEQGFRWKVNAPPPILLRAGTSLWHFFLFWDSWSPWCCSEPEAQAFFWCCLQARIQSSHSTLVFNTQLKWSANQFTTLRTATCVER